VKDLIRGSLSAALGSTFLARFDVAREIGRRSFVGVKRRFGWYRENKNPASFPDRVHAQFPEIILALHDYWTGARSVAADAARAVVLTLNRHAR
jgi:hypothetical protein